jgi:hypothetical protein
MHGPYNIKKITTVFNVAIVTRTVMSQSKATHFVLRLKSWADIKSNEFYVPS